MKTVFFLSGVFDSVLLFFAVITDPRPGHDFGKQHPFNYDYSYWSLTVSIEHWAVCDISTAVLAKQTFSTGWTISALSSELLSQESRAIEGRTAQYRRKFSYASNFTV